MRDVSNDYCVMFLCNIGRIEELDRLNALGFRFCSDVTVVPVARHLINVQHKRASKELRSTLENALGPLAQGLLPTCARVTASHPSKARRNALILLINKHDRRQSSLSRTICLHFTRPQKPHQPSPRSPASYHERFVFLRLTICPCSYRPRQDYATWKLIS